MESDKTAELHPALADRLIPISEMDEACVLALFAARFQRVWGEVQALEKQTPPTGDVEGVLC